MKKRNLFKLAALTAVFALGSMFANAQVVTGGTDIPKQQPSQLGQDSGYVKVIDNKGTVKFLQSTNGITMFTNTAPSGGIVTTWQLGGTLSEDTYIDVNGKEFGFLGLDTVTAATGLQLIVTDPDGTIHRMDFTSLIQSGRVRYDVTANLSTGTLTIPVIGVPTGALSFQKVSVYRNGAKLLASSDYTISTDIVTIVLNSELEDLYSGDVIEIHFIK